MSGDTTEVTFAPLYLKLKIKVFFPEHEKPKVWIMALSFEQETTFLWLGNPNVCKKLWQLQWVSEILISAYEQCM